MRKMLVLAICSCFPTPFFGAGSRELAPEIVGAVPTSDAPPYARRKIGRAPRGFRKSASAGKTILRMNVPRGVRRDVPKETSAVRDSGRKGRRNGSRK